MKKALIIMFFVLFGSCIYLFNHNNYDNMVVTSGLMNNTLSLSKKHQDELYELLSNYNCNTSDDEKNVSVYGGNIYVVKYNAQNKNING